MQYIIISTACLLVGLYTGFYFGYLKKEKEPPPMPMISEIKALKEYMSNIKDYIEDRLESAEIKDTKEDKEPTSWFDQ